jgi:HEAT repeat protein
MSQETEELTEEQKAHIAVLRSKFFRAVSIISIVGVIIFMVIMRFTVYNFKSVKDYESYITHKDKFMRFNAAKALGNFEHNPEATKALLQLLDDPAREVRWHAAASLSKLKDPNAVSKLLEVLQKEKDIQAMSIYIYTLGQIKDDSSIDILKNLFDKYSKASISEHKIIKYSIIQALASINSDKSNGVLLTWNKSKNTDEETKKVIAKMIETKGNYSEKKPN